MPLNPRPWDESFTKRYLESLDPELVRDGKEWRTRKAEAGKPSSFADLCRVKGLCSACAATGIAMNENGVGVKVVGMDGNTRLFADCDVCGGTGKIVRRKPGPGDSVILSEFPPGLLDDLPTEDQRAISAIIGKPVRLNEYADDGRAEIEFTDADGVIHFIFVRPDIISMA